MDPLKQRRQEAELARLARVKKRAPHPIDPLGPALLQFFKVSVEKRNAKFGKVADAWAKLVPQTLAERCALESFSRGTLSVLVDSSGHLYELKQLLLAGLEKQLLLACGAAGLKKITLKRGRWYDEGGGDGGERKLRF
ncbi:MAG TPA: DciA family protein [Humisphaera sp.]